MYAHPMQTPFISKAGALPFSIQYMCKMQLSESTPLHWNACKNVSLSGHILLQYSFPSCSIPFQPIHHCSHGTVQGGSCSTAHKTVTAMFTYICPSFVRKLIRSNDLRSVAFLCDNTTYVHICCIFVHCVVPARLFGVNKNSTHDARQPCKLSPWVENLAWAVCLYCMHVSLGKCTRQKL